MKTKLVLVRRGKPVTTDTILRYHGTRCKLFEMPKPGSSMCCVLWCDGASCEGYTPGIPIASLHLEWEQVRYWPESKSIFAKVAELILAPDAPWGCCCAFAKHRGNSRTHAEYRASAEAYRHFLRTVGHLTRGVYWWRNDRRGNEQRLMALAWAEATWPDRKIFISGIWW